MAKKKKSTNITQILEIKKLEDSYKRLVRLIKGKNASVIELTNTWKAYVGWLEKSTDKLREFGTTNRRTEKQIGELTRSLISMVYTFGGKDVFSSPAKGMEKLIDLMLRISEKEKDLNKIVKIFEKISIKANRGGFSFEKAGDELTKLEKKSKSTITVIDKIGDAFRSAGIYSADLNEKNRSLIQSFIEGKHTFNEYQKAFKDILGKGLSSKESSIIRNILQPPDAPPTPPTQPTPPTTQLIPVADVKKKRDWTKTSPPKHHFPKMTDTTPTSLPMFVMSGLTPPPRYGPKIPPSPPRPYRLPSAIGKGGVGLGGFGKLSKPPVSSLIKPVTDPTHPQYKAPPPGLDWGVREKKSRRIMGAMGRSDLRRAFTESEFKVDYGTDQASKEKEARFQKTLRYTKGKAFVPATKGEMRLASAGDVFRGLSKKAKQFGGGMSQAGDMSGMFQKLTKINPKVVKGMGGMFKGLAKGGNAIGAAGGAIGVVVMAIMELLVALDPFKLVMDAISTIMGSWGAILQTAFLPIVTLLFEEAFSEENMELINMLKDAFAELAEGLKPVFQAVFPLIGFLVKITIALMPLVVQLLPTITLALTYLQLPLRGLLMTLQFLVPILGVLMGVTNFFVLGITTGVQIMSNASDRFANGAIVPITKAMKTGANFLIGVINGLTAGINSLDIADVFADIPAIPLLAKQGIVQRSGVAKVHAGEVVVRTELIKEVFQEQMSVTNNFYGNTDGLQQMEYEQTMMELYNHRRRR